MKTFLFDKVPFGQQINFYILKNVELCSDFFEQLQDIALLINFLTKTFLLRSPQEIANIIPPSMSFLDWLMKQKISIIF